MRMIIIVGCTLAGALWLWHVGPMHAIRITTPLQQMAPFWYLLSAFPILGMLTADLWDLYTTRGVTSPTIELAIQIALLVLVSSGRLGMRLPISGHSLLAGFFIARRFVTSRPLSQRSRIELAFAFAILAMLTYIKLVWWTDPITLFSGIFLGALLALAPKILTPERTTAF
ncbi:MAG TPA: hypothetical protein VFG11_09355 [Acidobacteriota bacterium]|nr:hypothetical protein [Acidobacteriota bacterium]